MNKIKLQLICNFNCAGLLLKRKKQRYQWRKSLLWCLRVTVSQEVPGSRWTLLLETAWKDTTVSKMFFTTLNRSVFKKLVLCNIRTWASVFGIALGSWPWHSACVRVMRYLWMLITLEHDNSQGAFPCSRLCCGGTWGCELLLLPAPRWPL